ncbi:MAG TPA: hypothetical protein VFY10_07580 [Dehalococcoidia bacterium]|nr:hypothetical protein [Dehalococcoidia bacterium]
MGLAWFDKLTTNGPVRTVLSMVESDAGVELSDVEAAVSQAEPGASKRGDIIARKQGVR